MRNPTEMIAHSQPSNRVDFDISLNDVKASDWTAEHSKVLGDLIEEVVEPRRIELLTS